MTEIGTTGVVAKARAVYPDSTTKTTGDVVSTLPYGVQWDATINFILTKYPEDILTDSQDYGNYADPDTYEGGLTNTGNPEFPKYMLNNIYDLAGNLNELTMETNSSNYRVCRGGSYRSSGSAGPVSSRPAVGPDDVSGSIGFRLALYIK